jgi:hypothetical protein
MLILKKMHLVNIKVIVNGRMMISLVILLNIIFLIMKKDQIL